MYGCIRASSDIYIRHPFFDFSTNSNSLTTAICGPSDMISKAKVSTFGDFDVILTVMVGRGVAMTDEQVQIIAGHKISEASNNQLMMAHVINIVAIDTCELSML